MMDAVPPGTAIALGQVQGDGARRRANLAVEHPIAAPDPLEGEPETADEIQRDFKSIESHRFSLLSLSAFTPA
jgi:hypothetical protein